MQAITTTYHGPTDTRGSRITARCEAGSITVPYDHSAYDAHTVAFVALVKKLGWQDHGTWYEGHTKNGNVYVCSPKHASSSVNIV